MELLVSTTAKQVISQITALSHHDNYIQKCLKDLRTTLLVLQPSFLFAEKRSSDEDDDICSWLQQTRDAVYHLQDVLDELSVGYANQMKRGWFLFRSRVNNQNDDALAVNKLKKLMKTFRKIVRRKDELQLKEDTATSEIEVHHVNNLSFSSLQEKTPPVYEIIEEKKVIIDALFGKQSEENVSVIPIVGLGGMGKTTLARSVFNDENVKVEFELRLWAYVSREFDLIKVGQRLLESATNEECFFTTLQVLYQNLEKVLSGKKCLIVLDDIWSDDDDDWSQLRHMIISAQHGSKILLTTSSSTRVAEMFGTIVPLHLKGLPESICWSIFKQSAFTSEYDHESGSPQLVQIGKEIVHKCKGVVLAVNALGGTLRSMRMECEWLSVRDDKTWESHQNEGLMQKDEVLLRQSVVLSALKIAYSRLPPELKICFTYCSIFPKGCSIDAIKLVEQWISLGFIISTDGEGLTKKMEVGCQYLEKLLSVSFLQDYHKNETTGRYMCRMHDSVHDLAQELAAGMRVVIADAYQKALHEDNKAFRYATVVGYRVFPSNMHTAQLTKVRSLHLKECYSKELPDEMFSNMTFLHVLDLSGCFFIVELPHSIENLKRLCYIDASNLQIKTLPHLTGSLPFLEFLHLSNCKFEILPESITKLQSLCSLNLSRCSHLRSLPSTISNLQKLQYLNLSKCERLQYLPEEISLINLQSLDLSDCNSLQKLLFTGNIIHLDNVNLENYQRISELRNIEDLKLPAHMQEKWGETKLRNISELQHIELQDGELVIGSLENVDPAEAANANLKENQVLRSLTFRWDSKFDENGSRETDASVLQSLQPPSSLKVMEVINYGGSSFPIWMMYGIHKSIPNLVKLVLNSISKCECLPPLGQLTALKELHLQELSNLKKIGREFYGEEHQGTAFPSLEVLQLESIPNLEEWLTSLQENENDEDTKFKAFPFLDKLYLSDCPKLLIKPYLPQSVVELELHGKVDTILSNSLIGTSWSSRLNSLTVSNCELQSNSWKCLEDLIELEELRLLHCHTLPTGIKNLVSIKFLEIKNCTKLDAQPEWLQDLTMLSKVESDDPILHVLPKQQEITLLKKLESDDPSLQEYTISRGKLFIKRASSNAKSESPKIESPFANDDEERSKLPSNPAEVKSLRGNSAGNLIAFSFSELQKITDNFRQDHLIGGGGFGRVYKGIITKDFREDVKPLQVAVKVHDGDNSFQGHREWLAEVLFLGKLSHPNLVKLVGYCCENEHRVLIYEFMPGGSVESKLFSRTLVPLPWSMRMKVALSAAKGLAYLHDAEIPVIYRDFKTSNILLDEYHNAKLSDFGLAKEGPLDDKSHGSTRIMRTCGFPAAPEYMMTGHLTTMSDVYSFGVVLLELLTGRKSLDKSRPVREQTLADWTFPLLNQKKKVLSIVDPRLNGDYPEKAAQKIAMLAYHCLNRSPKVRPLIRDIVDSLEPLQIPVKV